VERPNHPITRADIAPPLSQLGILEALLHG
jgi:hypothetical protein